MAVTISENGAIWLSLDCIHTSQLEKLQPCHDEKKQSLIPQNKCVKATLISFSELQLFILKDLLNVRT